MRAALFRFCAVTIAGMNSKSFENIKTADLHIFPKLGDVKVGDEIVRLGPVNMKVLMVLIQHQDQLVSRDELFDAVWKNQVISDDTLTRCISDLRTQIGKHSQYSLIKTIPKKGYQWLPGVELLTEQEPQKRSQIKSNIYWVLAGLVLVFILSSGFLWLANSRFQSNYTQMVLMPIQANLMPHQLLAKDMEDLLRENILQTKKMRFLANSISSNTSNRSFTGLANEFGVKWIVEGRIRQHQDKIRITLSLVDMRTALEVYSLTSDMNSVTPQLDKQVHEFINKVEELLEL
jgi:DNA-binding winged helix-turn-helix (wHTH) protein